MVNSLFCIHLLHSVFVRGTEELEARRVRRPGLHGGCTRHEPVTVHATLGPPVSSQARFQGRVITLTREPSQNSSLASGLVPSRKTCQHRRP